MRGSHITGIVTLVVALHVAVLSFVFGPRNMGYLMSATLSATLIWGAVFVLSKRRRGAGLIAGTVVALAVQQLAYQVCKARLPGFWWPLAQFAALQWIIVYTASRIAARQLLGELTDANSEKQAREDGRRGP